MAEDLEIIAAIIRENEQTARAMRERAKLSIAEAERREAENVELAKKLPKK